MDLTPALNIVGFEPGPDACAPRWKGHMVVDYEGTRMRLPFWVLPERRERLSTQVEDDGAEGSDSLK